MEKASCPNLTEIRHGIWHGIWTYKQTDIRVPKESIYFEATVSHSIPNPEH